MELLHFLGIAFALAAVALMARFFERSPVTIPMLCLGIGLVGAWIGITPADNSNEIFRIIAEATLAIVLFADASMLNLRKIRGEASWPIRMLVIGLPLSVLIGALANVLIFPGAEFWSLVLLAALLAPTDAALGASVVSNQQVPQKVRDTVVAESGLNDGIALPFIIFAACATIGEQHQFAGDGWLIFAAKQIGFGVLAGVVLGTLGGFLLKLALKAGFASTHHGAIFVLFLVAVTFLLTEEISGNSFVAVFVAGLCFGASAQSHSHVAREFLETEGMILTMVSFVFIGAFVLPSGLDGMSWQVIAAVAVSLLIVRPLAIWLSLTGSGATAKTKLFLGWFGPRGLATALFALFVLLEFELIDNRETILAVTAAAVLISTVVHGVSAYWAGKWFPEKADEA